VFYVFGICLKIASILNVGYAPNVEGDLYAYFFIFFLAIIQVATFVPNQQ